MKKLFSLLILVVLFGICATVPGKLRQADAIYEQRIVALVDIVEGSLKSVASSGYLEIDVYAPKVAWQENRDLFTVTGIVGLSAPDGSEFFETFAANVGNGCEGAPRPDCARVDALTVGGSQLMEAGELVGRIRGMSLDTADGGNLIGSIAELEPADVAMEQTGRTPTLEAESTSTVSEADDRHSDLARRDTADPRQERTPDSERDSANQVAEIQRALKSLGYDPGPVDNLVGPKTFSAILAYQRRHGLEPDGKVSRKLLEHIEGGGRDGTD